ncbi:hypothetical protein [Zunongwangia sp.]|uniref:lipid-binding SYLF domain-containing protein n=1 Tax=Zunongwangia sp. TaxID=1965325 RepID=UPI003AA849B8
MKRRNMYMLGMVGIFMLLFSGNLLAQTEEQQELINDAKESKAAFIEQQPEMAGLFDKAEAYVIFPNVGKGAYILGGAAGNGVLFENGKVVGFAELRQVDIGLQIGGQAFRQAILFQTPSELAKFKKGDYKFSGDVSAVAIEKGKSKSVEFSNGRAIVTMPKAGAMVELSVGGQKFDYRAMK